MVEEPFLAGAEIIKMRIKSDSSSYATKNRIIGWPQLSAVSEYADTTHGLDDHIISAGCWTVASDVSKSFDTDSNFVMLNGMSTGCDQCPDNKIMSE
jgi:hypothetical protein